MGCYPFPLSPIFTLPVLFAQSLVQKWCAHPVPLSLHICTMLRLCLIRTTGDVSAQTNREGEGLRFHICALFPFRIRLSFVWGALLGGRQSPFVSALRSTLLTDFFAHSKLRRRHHPTSSNCIVRLAQKVVILLIVIKSSWWSK